MKRLLFIAFGIVIAFLISVAVFVGLSKSQQVIPVTENSVTQLASDLQNSTKVPLALPPQIPVKDKYYSAIDFVSEERYQVSLNYSKECYGVSNCSFGSVSGKVASVESIQEEYGNIAEIIPAAKSPNPDQAVQLINGIEGLFIPYVCGANCSDSRVVWGQNGYHYSVSLGAKVVPEEQEVQTLINMANSAIQNR